MGYTEQMIDRIVKAIQDGEDKILIVARTIDYAHNDIGRRLAEKLRNVWSITLSDGGIRCRCHDYKISFTTIHFLPNAMRGWQPMVFVDNSCWDCDVYGQWEGGPINNYRYAARMGRVDAISCQQLYPSCLVSRPLRYFQEN